MEPRKQSSEQLPPIPSSTEALPPPGELHHPERQVDLNEAAERRMGQQVEAAPQQIAQPPASALPAPVVATDEAVKTDDRAASSQSTPLVAADEDLIEKEWVDKAKNVIAETKDDPYKRETEVKKLQAEYIRKRYGRVIGDDEQDLY